MNQARRDRPDEIGGIDASHCRPDSVDLQEIAEHDHGTEIFQRLRPAITAVHHCAHVESERQRLLDGGTAGVSCGACDQHFAAHDGKPSLQDSISSATRCGISDCSQCPAGTKWNDPFLKWAARSLPIATPR